MRDTVMDDAIENSGIMKYFSYEHLRNEDLREMSKMFHELAHKLAKRQDIEDEDELDTALRKLLEAKDAAVRSLL